MPTLEIDNLSFHNRGPYSFRVESGECVGLQGDSGAEKSLLLRAIADHDPRTGSLRLFDARHRLRLDVLSVAGEVSNP